MKADMKKYLWMIPLCFGLLAVKSGAQSFHLLSKAGSADLERLFAHPSAEAKPWVFWFWMNGNITSNGITADLEAMSRIGIGGAVMMGVDFDAPAGTADFNSPLWRGLYAHTADEARRLGIRLSLHQCDGYATAGGPWIAPDRSMKLLVWTAREIEGPLSGPIQLEKPLTKESFYEEVSVTAVPLPAKTVLPAVTATVDGTNAPALVDGDLKNGTNTGSQIELRFAAPRTVSALVFHLPRFDYGADMPSTVEVSADGSTFSEVSAFDLNVNTSQRDQDTLTVSFPAAEVRAVRILTSKPRPTPLGEIEALAEPRVNLWEIKSGYARDTVHGGETKWLDAAPVPPDLAGIATNQILDLSSRLAPDGTLDWTAPAGRWLILRAGMTCTAKTVTRGTAAGLGLEADKMSSEDIRFHFDSFAKGLIAGNNAVPGYPVYSVHADSWEAGIQTWSAAFRQEFETRRGYSMTPWMPVLLSGLVIGSAEESERFLRDVRRTMSDLIRDNYFGALRQVSHENGTLFQSEAIGRQMFMFNPIDYSAMTDIAMGEFWMPKNVRVDCRIAASVAHIYNRPIAAAEAYTEGTGNFQDDPFSLKTLGDQAFCTGINRFVFHRYAMQPWTGIAPGMTYVQYGINFERTQTWWENGGKAWVEYITRCQSLLQSGLFAADVIHYIGDDAPNYLGHRDELWSPVPDGYDYDGCNLEILKQLAADGSGNLVLPSGMRYRVLLLPNRDHMTLEALQKIEELVTAGATVVGPKPLRTPGWKDWNQNDTALREIAGRLWGGIDGQTVTENRYGSGRVVYGTSLAGVLAGIAPPDFDYSANSQNTVLRYIHRRTDTAEFYFVASADSNSVNAVTRFRVTGKAPELWNPATGETVKPAVYREVNGVTELPVHFDPAGSVFVVFRDPADAQALVSVSRDGQDVFPVVQGTNEVLVTAANNADVTNNFTMALWLNPGEGVTLPAESDAGTEGLGGNNCAVYPAPGHEIYTASDAGAGISAGTNGIVVLTHGATLFAPVLVYSGPVTNWTHVAVVFNNKTPQLYLNGTPVKSGLVSARTVHPSMGVVHGRTVPVFTGQTTGWVQRAGVMDAGAIAAAMSRTLPNALKPAVPEIVFNGTALSTRSGSAGSYQARTASGQNVELTVSGSVQSTLTGPWTVAFPPGKQAPASITLPALVSWTESADDGVKYFSGTAAYSKTFDFQISDPSARIILDLGQVKNIAEVSLNGTNFGTLWKPPFTVDVTAAVRAGTNQLEIKVTNLWPNRLIGDEKLHPDPSLNYSAEGLIQSIPDWVNAGGTSPAGRTTFLLWRHYNGTEPLLTSGLLGPVTLTEVN
ncbi:MAG: glycosyl hydrolase [Kiritimatiellales bacterium]|jgi:hypothetical protein